MRKGGAGQSPAPNHWKNLIFTDHKKKNEPPSFMNDKIAQTTPPVVRCPDKSVVLARGGMGGYLTPPCNLPTNVVAVPPHGGGGQTRSDGSPWGGGGLHHKTVPYYHSVHQLRRVRRQVFPMLFGPSDRSPPMGGGGLQRGGITKGGIRYNNAVWAQLHAYAHFVDGGVGAGQTEAERPGQATAGAVVKKDKPNCTPIPTRCPTNHKVPNGYHCSLHGSCACIA